MVSPATRNAQKGESGTLIATDYLGQDTLQAYAPLVIKDSELHWAIVAKVNTAEAFDKEAAFTKTMVLVTAGMIFGVCLLAIRWPRSSSVPSGGSRRAHNGSVRVTTTSRSPSPPETK